MARKFWNSSEIVGKMEGVRDWNTTAHSHTALQRRYEVLRPYWGPYVLPTDKHSWKEAFITHVSREAFADCKAHCWHCWYITYYGTLDLWLEGTCPDELRSSVVYFRCLHWRQAPPPTGSTLSAAFILVRASVPLGDHEWYISLLSSRGGLFVYYAKLKTYSPVEFPTQSRFRSKTLGPRL